MFESALNHMTVAKASSYVDLLTAVEALQCVFDDFSVQIDAESQRRLAVKKQTGLT